MARRRLIRASEIGEYVYCRRAWWLHRSVGLEPAGRERRAQGAALHTQHGRRVWGAQLLLLGALALGLLAIVLIFVQ